MEYRAVLPPMFCLRLLFWVANFFLEGDICMKKKMVFAVVAVMVMVTSVILSGCSAPKMQLGFMNGADSDAQYEQVEIGNYEGKTMLDLLRGEKQLNAVIEDSGEYVWLQSIGNLVPKEQEYVALYLSLEEYKDTTEWAAAPITKDGVTYYSTNVGIAELPVREDAKYMFVLLG